MGVFGTHGIRLVRLVIVAIAATLATLSVTSTMEASGADSSSEQVQLSSPTAAVPAAGGGFLIADQQNCYVYKVASNGTTATVAGNGSCADTGDGGPATSAELANPTDAVPTADGGTLIAEGGLSSELIPGDYPVGGDLIRKVDAAGIISTAAGDGFEGDTGDGGPATKAEIDTMSVVPFDAPGAAVETSGNGYLLTDTYDCVVRKVDTAVDPPTISRVAGDGVCGVPNPTFGAAACPSPSFCLATGETSSTQNPFGLAGNAAISGDPSDGATARWTVQGNIDPDTPSTTEGTPYVSGAACPSTTLCVGFDGQGDALTSTDPSEGESATWNLKAITDDSTTGNTLMTLACPSTTLCLAGDSNGDIWTTTDPASGAAATWSEKAAVASSEFDDISCSSTSLCVGIDPDGEIVASTDPNAGSSAKWTTVTVTQPNSNNTEQLEGVSCHSQASPAATLCAAVALGSQGGDVVTSIDPGAASPKWTVDANIDSSYFFSETLFGGGIVSCPGVNLCVAVDHAGNVVTSTDPGKGTSATWTVKSGLDGGGSVATVSCPSTTLCVAGGSHEDVLTSADPSAGATAKWAIDNFTNGDGGPATEAYLDHPVSAAPTADGGFLIAELGDPSLGSSGKALAGSCAIRKVSATGTITTVAGQLEPPQSAATATTCGFSGDGGPATSARLDEPTTAVPTPGGGFLISDLANNRVRSVSASGTITTVAGNGESGTGGGGGPATDAPLQTPSAAVPLAGGGFLIGSYSASQNNTATVRAVSSSGTISTVAVGTTTASYTLTVSTAGSGSGAVTSSPAGISCPSACSAPFAAGTTVTLTATPAAGSTLTEWSGAGCSGTSACTVTMSADQSVTATFSPSGTVASTNVLTVIPAGTGSGAVTSSPAGISCPGTCSASYPTGSQVTLAATPASRSTFAGWSGAGCSGTGTCTVTMSSGQSVTATFNAEAPASSSPPMCTLRPSTSKILLPATKKKPKQKPSKAQTPGTVKLGIECNQSATVQLSGTVTETLAKKHKGSTSKHHSQRHSVRAAIQSVGAAIHSVAESLTHGSAKAHTRKLQLGSQHTSVTANVSRTVVVKLPHAALTALAGGTKESASFTLTATNAHGTTHATATISRLKATH